MAPAVRIAKVKGLMIHLMQETRNNLYFCLVLYFLFWILKVFGSRHYFENE